MTWVLRIICGALAIAIIILSTYVLAYNRYINVDGEIKILYLFSDGAAFFLFIHDLEAKPEERFITFIKEVIKNF